MTLVYTSVMQRQRVTRQHSTLHPSLVRAKLYKGIYARVARGLGVSTSVVRRVGQGINKSERITLALMSECRKIELAIEKISRERAA